MALAACFLLLIEAVRGRLAFAIESLDAGLWGCGIA